MNDEKSVILSPPDTNAISVGPIRRAKALPPLNPLDGVDFNKIETKEQAYLMGFINGQMMGGKR